MESISEDLKVEGLKVKKYIFTAFKNKKVVIFGTGDLGRNVYNKIKNKISYFIDNNTTLHETEILNVKINSAAQLYNEDKSKIVVVVASMYYNEISAQLTAMGFIERVHYYDARQLFVQDYMDEKDSWLNEASFFNQKIQYYFEAGLWRDVLEYVEDYSKINPLDYRINYVSKLALLTIKEVELAVLNLEDLKPNVQLLYRFKKAEAYYDSGDLQTALDMYEHIYMEVKDDESKELVYRLITDLKHNANPNEKIPGKKYKNVHFIAENMFSYSFYKYIREEISAEDNYFILIEDLNDFRFFTNEESEKLTKVISKDLEEFSLNIEVIRIVNNAEKIFIHFLRESISDFLMSTLNENKKMYWIVWGADLYSYIDEKLFDHNTEEFFEEENYLPYSCSQNALLRKKKFIRELDGILAIMDGDYDLVQKYFPTNAKLYSFAYPSVLDYEHLSLISNDSNIKNEKLTILIGNSATPTNNHITVLKSLARYKEEIAEVIVPLSYGDQVYGEKIAEIGRELFGSKFTPLFEFLSSEQYSAVINKCDLVFMNHWRQQGVGNILAAMYLGKSVYISERTTTYESMKKMGFALYSIEQFFKSNEGTLSAYVHKDIGGKNGEICDEYFRFGLKEMYTKLFT